jgi:hypothetical protein
MATPHRADKQDWSRPALEISMSAADEDSNSIDGEDEGRWQTLDDDAFNDTMARIM